MWESVDSSRMGRHHAGVRLAGRDEEKDELHQRNVVQMFKSADGSAGLLHKITKPTAWRGGVQILKEEEDARPMDRCEAKRKEWARHWQCGENVQDIENELWKNEALNNLGESMPRLKESELEKASRLYKANTGEGCDGFHPKVPLDLTQETRGEVVEFLETGEHRVGNGRNKHARRCSS